MENTCVLWEFFSSARNQPKPPDKSVTRLKTKRGTEGNVFLGEAQAAPLEHRPWAGAGCGAAEQAAGSVSRAEHS